MKTTFNRALLLGALGCVALAICAVVATHGTAVTPHDFALATFAFGGVSHRAIGAGGIARIASDRWGRGICFDATTEGGTKTLEQLATEVKGEFQKSLDIVKGIAEEALGKSKSGEQLTADLKTKADEALTKMNVLNGQLSELEQKVAKGLGGGDPEEVKTFGAQFVESENFKAFKESGFSKSARGADLQFKATITSATTDAAGSVGDAIRPTRLAGLLPLPERTLTIVDLLTPGQMDGNTLEYVQETGFTNGAGMVAEGASKPESDIKYDLKQTGAKVIAHWFKTSKQVLDDVSQLRSNIDGRLLYGLALKKEQQILNGDGTGANLFGIIPQATAFASPISLPDLNILDVMRLAMLQGALAEFPATGHVLNPADWAAMETLKDDNGRYIIGNPQGGTAATLWRLPVVETQAIAQRKFLTGAFKLGAQYFDRWLARIETGYVNDDFIKNLITILGEERGALAVYRPEAFIYGDFDTALGS